VALIKINLRPYLNLVYHKKKGWGLGLSLTKRIVEEYHKGTIKVLQSEIGKGTTMQIDFKKKLNISFVKHLFSTLGDFEMY
jgi:nitrogen fixation/metabolism regulation signal transduction histidine kinase